MPSSSSLSGSRQSARREPPCDRCIRPAALANVLFCNVGTEVHGRRVVPAEKGLIRCDLFLNPLDGTRSNLLVNGFHALLGKRARVRNLLFADPAPSWILGSIVRIGGEAVKHTSWSEFFLETRIFWIVRQFRLFFGVQVVEIAKEFVKTVYRRQVFISITQVVLAKLTGGITEWLKQFRMAGSSA